MQGIDSRASGLIPLTLKTRLSKVKGDMQRMSSFASPLIARKLGCGLALSKGFPATGFRFLQVPCLSTPGRGLSQ